LQYSAAIDSVSRQCDLHASCGITFADRLFNSADVKALSSVPNLTLSRSGLKLWIVSFFEQSQATERVTVASR